MNLIRTNIYLPKDLKERIRKLAFKTRRSMVSIVRQALQEWLKKQK